jgi:hypothetical protein
MFDITIRGLTVGRERFTQDFSIPYLYYIELWWRLIGRSGLSPVLTEPRHSSAHPLGSKKSKPCYAVQRELPWLTGLKGYTISDALPSHLQTYIISLVTRSTG